MAKNEKIIMKSCALAECVRSKVKLDLLICRAAYVLYIEVVNKVDNDGANFSDK